MTVGLYLLKYATISSTVAPSGLTVRKVLRTVMMATSDSENSEDLVSSVEPNMDRSLAYSAALAASESSIEASSAVSSFLTPS